MHTIQTILHPTDFSDSASHALRLACSLARDHEANVVILHVADTQFPFAGETPALIDLSEDEERTIMEHLEALRHDHPEVPITYRLGKGHVIDSILATANEVDAGLIVMGTHGRTGLKRLLMGSVAENIVRQAHCPVLTVKTPAPIKAADKSSDKTEDSFVDRPMLATPY